MMLVGREEDLAELEDLLGDVPLVAVHGAWGCGKTALLKEFCQRQQDTDQALSTTYVDLEGCRDETQVVRRIASSLSLASYDERGLVVALRGQASSVLLLDSCEELSDESWRWIRTLSNRCLGTSIFCATSQRPPIDLLQFQLEGLSDSAAVELFVIFAAEYTGSDDELMQAERIAAQVVGLLGGVPRSLRLAAAFLGKNSADALLERLRAGELPLSEDFQRWLEKFFQSHWSDLSPSERSLLCTIAVVPDGIDDSTLRIVCESPLVADLASLQGRGLLERQDTRLRAPLVASVVTTFEADAVAAARERMCERLFSDVRQHHEDLEDPNFTQGRDWYLQRELLLRSLLSNQGEPSSSARELALGIARTLNVTGRVDETIIREEWCAEDDLGVALRVERARAFLAVGNRAAFWEEVDVAKQMPVHDPAVARRRRQLWAVREWQRTGRMTEELREITKDLPEIGRVRGASAFNEGDLESAKRIFEEMTSFAASVGLGIEMLHALSGLAIVETQLNNLPQAEHLLQRVMSVASGLRCKTYLALAAGNMAEVKFRQGGKELARELAARSASELAALGQAYAYAQARMLQGDLEAADCEWTTALVYYRQVERLYEEFDGKLHKRRVRRRIAMMHQQCGEPDKAKESWAAVDDGEAPVIAEQHESWAAAFEGREIPARQGRAYWHERLLVDAIEQAKTRASQGAPPVNALMVSSGYDWFSVPGYERYHFRRDTPMRRMLKVLVEMRLASPGAWISPEKLMEVGWPNDRFVGSSGVNRLWVTLSRLRSVGFEGFLQTREGSYRLCPDQEVNIDIPED